MKQLRRSQAGFTLIEIMVVIVILGLLATMVAINVVPIEATARDKATQADLKQIEQAVRLFMLNNGNRLPTMEQLTTPDAKGHVWADIGVDPWGNDYLLRPLDGTAAFEVVSIGPDGQEDTEDDVSSKDLRRQRSG